MTEDIFKILEELKILIKELPRPTTEKKKAYNKAYQQLPKRKAYVSERYLKFKGCEVCKDKDRCRVYLSHKAKRIKWEEAVKSCK
jgi:hypothetical protein